MKLKSRMLQIFSLSPSVRWMAAGISLLVILIFVGGKWVWPQNNLALNILISLVIAGVILLIAGRFIHLQSELISLQSRTSELERSASNTNLKLETVFRLSRKLVEANDENEVISMVLKESIDLVGAVGASLVPLDERGQPLTATSYGELPGQVMDAWIEYLASPEVRHQCGICQKLGTFASNCPLIEVPAFENLGYDEPIVVYCLSLQRGNREYGVLNLYLADTHKLDDKTQDFMRVLLDETALALESIHLLNREISVLHQLQAVKRRTDFRGLESNILKNVRNTLKADFVLLYLRAETGLGSRRQIFGDLPEVDHSTIDNLVNEVLNSEGTILLGEVDGEAGAVQSMHSVIAVPLEKQGEPAVGVLMAGVLRPHKFNNRHLTLLQTLAGQVSLVVQYAELLANIEFDSIMGERNRLAREIHDGLAQTLGYLKLQAAQMENQLASNDTIRLQENLSTTYRVLSEAYLDIRQAIDDLRIAPDNEGLSAWLQETCLELQENTGLPVKIEAFSPAPDFPPEIQAQLIRIVQEALSNVRKHASASQAWVIYRQVGEDFLIEIRDNGRGFSLEDIPGVSQYGLQGMRERSELIGADFQVISRPGEGTIVKVRLPQPVGENGQ